MVKTAVAAVGALAVLGTWGVPAAQAAGRSASQVSDVTIAWSDATHTKIRVTWDESTPVANTLTLERSSTTTLPIGTTTAVGANEFLVAVSYLDSTTNPQEVDTFVVEAAGGGEARSVGFDRFLPVMNPQLSFTAAGEIRWWLSESLSYDSTPGDPLDLDAPSRSTLRLLSAATPHTMGGCSEVTVLTTTALSGVFPSPGRAFQLSVLSTNEWDQTGVRGLAMGIDGTALTMTAPAANAFGAQTIIAGTTSRRGIDRGYTASACHEVSWGNEGERVDLQARNSTTSAWYIVGGTTSGYNGAYTFKVTNRGAREYRSVVLNQAASGPNPKIGAITASRLVRSTTRVVSAKFIAPVVSYGIKPQAYLWVDPAGSQRAALQFRNTSGAWQGLTYKTLYAGRGLVTFPWSRRGATQFRWWVPGSTTSTGLKVDPIYSGVFTLTVR